MSEKHMFCLYYNNNNNTNNMNMNTFIIRITQ